MTEDIPLEITSSDMANLPIFIAVLIVAAVVVRVYFSIKRNEKPPIARVFWCATLLIPLGVVAAWITNQLLVNEDSSLWVLSCSCPKGRVGSNPTLSVFYGEVPKLAEGAPLERE